MAKTKTPFFSMSSKGTVGGSLTTQKSGGDTILRSKPVPTDPYSLNQAYQRWDYRDYAYLWTLLSNSEKQVYRTTGSRYHITGFSQYMREQLKDLPDIMGRWRLDELSGATAFDSSKKGNNAVITGATPATGPIAGAYSFDGLNDNIKANNVDINLDGIYSLEFFFYSIGTDAGDFLASVGAPPWGQHEDTYRLDNSVAPPVFYVANMAGAWKSGAPIAKGIWHHAIVTHNSLANRWIVILDGAVYINVYEGKDLLATTGSVTLGQRHTGVVFGEATLDNAILRNRALDTTEALRHSARRYPS